MVQRRAARFVPGDYKATSSVTQMLEALQWTEVQQCKKRVKVIMLHLVAISPEPYLIPRGVALITRGYGARFLIPYSRIQSHQQSFFHWQSIYGTNYQLLSELPPPWKDSKIASRQLPYIRHASFNCICHHDGF
jgi:hypothetical protein